MHDCTSNGININFFIISSSLFSIAGRVRNLGIGEVTQMCSGHNFNIVVTRSESVYVWGQNNYGQLGTGDTKNRTEPAKLNLLEVIQVAAGKYHTMALTSGKFLCVLVF